MSTKVQKKIVKFAKTRPSLVRIFGLPKVKQFIAAQKNKFVFMTSSLGFIKRSHNSLKSMPRKPSLFGKALIRKYARESSVFYSYSAKKRSALFPQALRFRLNHKQL